MLNSVSFIKRLKDIMEKHSMSSSNFADYINVQRSSISHILSGRNKPSLDFVLKIVDKFPDIDINWLLKGDGTYEVKKQPTLSPTIPELFEKKHHHSETKENPTNDKTRVIKIVMFYDNGTFEEFNK